ncbi:ABC transporter permease [Lewinella cohaerens]|uniref:ABC transporter permease n=1 Tax=Lewinella cohaerens TaxID=70995 RepID=UPI00037F4D36|nr:ABC transporter permease [Lewinella cohaerens]
MRSHIIATIFSKEIKEVLRDKRMLYLIILLPFFLYPVLFTLIGGVGASQQEKLMQQEIAVWVSPNATDTPLPEILAEDPSLKVEMKAFTEADLEGQKRTMGIQLPDDYQERLNNGQSAEIVIYADQSQDVLNMRERILRTQLTGLGDQLLNERLASKELSPEFANPLSIDSVDLSPEESGDRMMVAFLPMMILLFIFIGCIYIAIDITAGEKERRTLQTLFTTTASTKEIVAGKFLAVAAVGIVSATMNILSLVVAMNIQAYLLEEESAGMAMNLAPEAWVWLVILVLLTTLFLGALSLAVVLLANSYKEAQSYVSPLMMVVLIPAMMAIMPGVELNMQTALIPVFNVALSIVAILKGNFDTSMLAIVAAASFVYGILALYLASLSFGNENIITGEKVNWKALLGK